MKYHFRAVTLKRLWRNTTHPAQLVRWKNSYTVVTIEHTATLTITRKGENIQHPQTLTTIIKEVADVPTTLGPHIYLSIIKIVSLPVMIINLFLPNILTHGNIGLLIP